MLAITSVSYQHTILMFGGLAGYFVQLIPSRGLCTERRVLGKAGRIPRRELLLDRLALCPPARKDNISEAAHSVPSN